MSLLDKLNMEDGTTQLISDCIMQAKLHEKIVAFGAGVGGGGVIQSARKK